MSNPISKAVITIIGTVILVIVSEYLDGLGLITPLYSQVIESILVILIGFIAYYIFQSLSNRIEEEKTRFNINKFIGFITAAFALIGIAGVWVKQLTYLAISIGLFSAGLSFSLQQPISSLVGWLILAFERPFTVGDRISIGGIDGDVIDYGVFFIRIMEIRQWTEADLYTGRILSVPTNYVLSNTVYNYSKDFGYIWDRIWIGLLYGSDYVKISKDINEIAMQVTENSIEKSQEALRLAQDKYFLQGSPLEPQTYISFNSNWVQIDLRYITAIGERSITHSELSDKILNYLTINNIDVASSSMNISMLPDTQKPGNKTSKTT